MSTQLQFIIKDLIEQELMVAMLAFNSTLSSSAMFIAVSLDLIIKAKKAIRI